MILSAKSSLRIRLIIKIHFLNILNDRENREKPSFSTMKKIVIETNWFIGESTQGNTVYDEF